MLKKIIIAPPKEKGGVYKVPEKIFEKYKGTKLLYSAYTSGDADKNDANNTIINNIVKSAKINIIESAANICEIKGCMSNELRGEIDLSELVESVYRQKAPDADRFNKTKTKISEMGGT